MNRTFTHPGQPEMQVEVILASQGPHQKPIYTLRLRYPRIIHAEAETHRIMYVDGRMVEVVEPGYGIMGDTDLNRNARSSRAVPVKTMLKEVRERPFVPWHWGKNQKGMQADEECNTTVRVPLYSQSPEHLDLYEYSEDEYENWEAWRYAAENAADMAEAFMDAGYHKQIPNRLLEPFSWIDTLITATEWDNFLWLRDHKDAEPHLQDLARLVKQAIEEACIQELKLGEWHLPYISRDDCVYANGYFDLQQHVDDPITHYSAIEWLRQISAARCARISYKPFDGDASYEKELARYDMLVSADRVHASPTEHQATPDTLIDFSTEFEDGSDEVGSRWNQAELHGNLTGYIQARKLIPNEAYTG